MRSLIFGTSYVDTVEKNELARQWVRLHGSVNQQCDLMLVDSASPKLDLEEHSRLDVVHFTDNIGHLGKKGRDGWGRAFCHGLRVAINNKYDYVAHIEGDSLFRRPVAKFFEFMREQDLPTFVCGINGTRLKEFAWIETGIMFFSVRYVRDSNFIERYNWPDGESKKYPHTPEAVVWELLDEDRALNIVPIRVMRDDKNILTKDNVGEYDWISHSTPEIYSTFVTSSMVPA